MVRDRGSKGMDGCPLTPPHLLHVGSAYLLPFRTGKKQHPHVLSCVHIALPTSIYNIINTTLMFLFVTVSTLTPPYSIKDVPLLFINNKKFSPTVRATLTV
jgi:hypothetical protein